MTDEPRVFEEAETATPSTTLRLRQDQMFPTLSSQEVERLRRFGSVRRYRDREPLFKTGDLDRGMFVVISGHVTITQRDGLGHQQPAQRLGLDHQCLDIAFGMAVDQSRASG